MIVVETERDVCCHIRRYAKRILADNKITVATFAPVFWQKLQLLCFWEITRGFLRRGRGFGDEEAA